MPTVAQGQQTQYAKPSDIPAEVFAALPTFSGAKLSPSGKKIGYFISLEGRKHLVVQNLDGSDQRVIPPWDDKLELTHFVWKSDDALIFKISMTLDRLVFRGKSTESRAMSYHLENPKFVWLGEPNVRARRERPSQNERIVDYLPNDPQHILLELDFELDGSPTVYKVNIETGERSKVQGGKKGINDWYVDQSAEVRLGFGYRPGSSKHNARYKNSDGDWIDLKKVDWAEKYEIEAFSADPNILYVYGLTRNGTKGLYRLDVEKGEIIDHVFSHEKVDVSGTIEHPQTGQLAGVSYVDDFYRINYLDQDLALLQRSLARVLPNDVVRIASKARDAELYLIFAESDLNPGDYYLYNRPEKKLDWITPVRSQIDPKLMATVKSVSIPMRDGSEIPGYLVLPKGVEPKNMPTVVLPHGGPQSRDTATWDYEAQFYASRGYAVLKPNFRGSEGYGPLFEAVGHMQWGGLMQDDVTDATKWLTSEGYSDPERICIVGSSYGGYAALMGVIKEPGLYRCAISVNGVSDLVKLKSTDRRGLIGGKAWTQRMGLDGADDSDVSPYHRAEDVSAPVLLMSSVDDARIPYKLSRDMNKKLRKLKKESRYVEIENGTHYMLTAQSRLTMLQAAEKFLAKHIGQ